MLDTKTKEALPVIPRLGNPWAKFNPAVPYKFLGKPQWTNGVGTSPLIVTVCEVRDGVNCEFSSFMIDHASLPTKEIHPDLPFYVIDGQPRQH